MKASNTVDLSVPPSREDGTVYQEPWSEMGQGQQHLVLETLLGKQLLDFIWMLATPGPMWHLTEGWEGAGVTASTHLHTSISSYSPCPIWRLITGHMSVSVPPIAGSSPWLSFQISLNTADSRKFWFWSWFVMALCQRHHITILFHFLSFHFIYFNFILANKSMKTRRKSLQNSDLQTQPGRCCSLTWNLCWLVLLDFSLSSYLAVRRCQCVDDFSIYYHLFV